MTSNIFDTKKIVISVITLLAGVIFLVTNLTYMISLIILIISLISIYLYLAKDDKYSIIAFLNLFIVVLIIKFSTHQIVGLVSYGAFVFVSYYFIVSKQQSDISSIITSIVTTFLLIEFYLVIVNLTTNIFAIGILTTAMYITILEILKNEHKVWDLNSYKYCIIFNIVAIPITIFYL